MESQNVERRDSKKSKGGGGGGNKGQSRGGGSNGGGGGSGKANEKQRSHSQKSGKPYREREIYRPPSLRSIKNQNIISPNEQQVSKGNPDDVANNQSQTKPKSNLSNNQKSSGNGAGNGLSSQNGSFNDTGNDLLANNNGYSLFGNGNGNGNGGGVGGGNSVPSSPLLTNRMQNNFNNAAAAFGLAKRMFNVNAKEFQFLPPGVFHPQQQQQQQISNFLSQFDPSLFYNNSPILASSGCYPLKQSKSSGNMNLLLQQQQQAAAFQQLQSAMGFNFPLQSGNFPGNNGGTSPGAGGSQFNRLSQSKSSGNVPGGSSNGKPRVRFDDEEADMDDDDFGPLGNYLASLKLNGDIPGMSPGGNFPSKGFPFQPPPQQQQQPNKVPLSPQPVLKSSLQKSRTGFYLNLYGNQQQQPSAGPSSNMGSNSPTKSPYPMNASNSMQQHASNFMNKLGNTGGSSTQSPSVVKRSRSFGPGTHHVPRTSATTLLSASTVMPSSTSHSVYSDFCITKWPKAVQELVTAAVTGVDRIPARNWIEMVNGIFEAMLCDYIPPSRKVSPNNGSLLSGSSSANLKSQVKSNDQPRTNETLPFGRELHSKSVGLSREDACGNVEDGDLEDDDDDDDDTDLTSAAVHIFLYFIQREKDRTVMESLLNTCFASFQRLSSCSISNAGSTGINPKSQQQQMKTFQNPPISRQWCNFLRFLSSLYAQVKLIRHQKQSQQQPRNSMDEMSFSLLALLCDSCLATLRSPQSYTAEMMGCLFSVLTSIGRDMEGTFPLKMKQLLAAVRDALLGIGPYHQQQNTPTKSGLSPIVQKTLMQLIELHAANWQLPASAVRYYYSSVNKSSTSSTNTNSKDNAIFSPSTPTHNQLQPQASNLSCSPSAVVGQPIDASANRPSNDADVIIAPVSVTVNKISADAGVSTESPNSPTSEPVQSTTNSTSPVISKN